MLSRPFISPNTRTPHSAPTSPGTEVMMGNDTENDSRSLATNQQICAIPHIKPLPNAGNTHGGSCGLRPLLCFTPQYTMKYVSVAKNIPQKCENT